MKLMTRRFGTAKRLGKMMNTEKCYFSWDIFDNLELLMFMKYHLSFGSAKPTKRLLQEVKQDLFEMYINDDLHKHPLSKQINDISKELELIL